MPRSAHGWGLFLLALLLTVRPLSAQAHNHAQMGAAARRIEPVRVDDSPVIDGDLADAVWARATVVEELTQQEPDEGAPATERTEVRFLYDERTLYIGVHAYDSEPDAVIATEMRRDAERILDEDNFQIILDTFKDLRSGYMFAVSPLGARLDQQIFEEGEGPRRGTSTLTANINRDWDGVWNASAKRTADGWVAEIAIPMVTLRFPDTDVQEWGLNFMRNIRRKNEQAFWAPIPKAYALQRVSLAGTLSGLTDLGRGRDLRVKPSVVGGRRSVLSDGARDNSVQRDWALDLKYGVTAGLNLDVTVNTDFAQAEVDDEKVNLTRFALLFPEKREFFLENAGQFAVGTAASIDPLANLFFSRRIGLTETGAQVPILAGARLTGKVGRNNVALMDIQTDDAYGMSGENFLVARYSRNVLARSKVGAIVINKEATGDDGFNRTVAADISLAPHPSISISAFVAKTSSPDLSGNDLAGHVHAGWLSRSWNIYAEYTDLQDNFNAEVGFVPRAGIRTSKLHIERNPRPGRYGIRMLEPMVNVTYTTDQHNRLLSRRIHHMLGTRFENGAYLNVVLNRYFERLDEPFQLRSDVAIAPGGYDFYEWRLSFDSNPSRQLYWSIQAAPQTFYDGTRNDLSLNLGVRVNSQLSALSGYSRNDVDLPAGAFTADIGSVGIDYAMSTRMTMRTLTQYNSSTHQWGTSARFTYNYRPGSDIFLVYDDVRRDMPGLPEFNDRRLLVKFTYLLSQ